jgi:predicted aspartyl protease
MKLRSALLFALMPIIAFARSLPLHVIRGYPVVEEVYIDNAGPYRFLIDTGAQSSAIRSDLAEKLKLRPAYRIEVATNAGSQAMVATMANRVSLGSKSSTGVELAVHDLAGIRCLDRGIQGVLGQNFLSHFNYLLDYRNRSLTFDTALPGGDRIEFEGIDQRPAIKAVREGKSLRLVLDSGASDLILFSEQADGRDAMAEARLIAATSQRYIRMSRAPELSVGSEVMRNVVVGFAPRDPVRLEDGLLPTSFFKAIYFNNEQHFVILNAMLP